MSDKHPSSNEVVRQLQLLLAGYGYNFYDKKNQARADDLLIRQKASSALGDAAQVLTVLEQEYRRRFIPSATRDAPYPPADIMNKLRRIGQLRGRIRDAEVKIRSMPVPAQDKTWWRFREEQTLLYQLLTFDCHLVEQTEQINQQVRQLTAEGWNEGEAPGAFDSSLQALEDLIRSRQQFLLIPTL